MTILAHAISDLKGVPAVTDYRRLDRYGMLMHTYSEPGHSGKNLKAAQHVINLSVPGNLRSVPLRQIIELRNKRGFKERQRAFHKALNEYLSNLEEGWDTSFIEKSLEWTWNDFSYDILQIGTGLTAFGLGVWILTEGYMHPAAGVKEIAGGITLAVGYICLLKNTWKHTEAKRLTRKYLVDLKKLKPLEHLR
jgi:hypothetical protein